MSSTDPVPGSATGIGNRCDCHASAPGHDVSEHPVLSPDTAPRLPDGWLHERLREVLPNATDEQIDGLVAVAEDYGRQLREARNV